eukprot:409548-Hanusia_phi.AAC.1
MEWSPITSVPGAPSSLRLFKFTARRASNTDPDLRREPPGARGTLRDCHTESHTVGSGRRTVVYAGPALGK